MEPDSRKRMVSSEQLNSLLVFMKEHPDLAKGLSRGRRGKLMTIRIWNSCAKQLNAVKDGAVKDGKGWSKYWCDWKYRVRRHALELKVSKESNKPATDSLTPQPLSSIEKTIMGIIGENTLDGVVIKSDPLAESMDHIEVEPENEQSNEVSNTQVYATTSKKRRRNSLEDVSYFDNPDSASSSPEKKGSFGDDDSEEDESTQFLRLEREKLENSRKTQESLQLIASELSRLTDVISQIKDVLLNRFNT